MSQPKQGPPTKPSPPHSVPHTPWTSPMCHCQTAGEPLGNRTNVENQIPVHPF